MRALTLINPWAALIASGVKLIENRTWRAPADVIGQRIAIHAGKKIDQDAIDGVLGSEDEHLNEYGGSRILETSLWRVTGAILCTAMLVGVIDENDDPDLEAGDGQEWWFTGPYGFVLRDVRLVAPIACKGALGFWRVPDDIAKQIGGAS